jgi:hypothetical protein
VKGLKCNNTNTTKIAPVSPYQFLIRSNANNPEAAMHIRGRFLEFQQSKFWRNGITVKEFLDYRKSVLEFLGDKEADTFHPLADTFLQLLGMSLVSHALKVTDQKRIAHLPKKLPQR